MNQNVMTIYPAGTTNFDYQGYGTLYDAYSAEVTEASSTNGNITETMEITYPVNGVLSDKMVEGNLVKAQISKTDGDYQIFEIDETEKSDNTVITAYLNAYPYRVLRMSFTNGGKFANFETLTRLLDYAKSYMPDLPTDFKITTNISNPINLAQTQTDPALTPEPTVFKDFSSLLDAILNKVSGQVKFGPRSIEILAHRGQDKSNIELRDDKNTNGISVKVDTTNIVNKIIPLLPVKDKDGNSTSGTVVGNIVTPKDPFRFINFYSGQVVNVDTQDLANSYFSRTNCNYPVTTATVTTSMIDEDLSDIRLFDIVSVYSSRINYTAKLKVSERVFDVLAGAVESFKLGTSSVNVFSTQAAAMNRVEQAVGIGNQALTSANGKNTNYYGDAKPTDGKEGDIWFHTVDGVSQMDQFTGGVWKTIVSDTFGKEVDEKVATAQAEASDAKAKAEEGVAKAESTAAKFDDTNQKVKQALDNSVSAQADASSAVAKAESTASEFGKVSQKTDSAVANALSAQASANAAVAQASSAAADSKDAKQIAGAVSQSYKTLTDGSTMTLAELESGLAAKLTRNDLDGYATQTWAQNQINVSADGLTAKLTSVQESVDGISVGGRNYLEQSSTFKWPELGEWHVDTEGYQGHAVLTGTQTLNNSQHGFSYPWLTCINSDVVVSFYAKAAKSSRLHSEPHGVGGGSGATDFRLTTEWARYSYKAHVGPIGTIYWWAIDANIQMWVTMPQVEIGTVVSDYHEAPEDVQSQITANSTKITANSKLIAASATQESVNSLTQKVTSNTAQLKLTATEADLKLVTQSVDALTGRVTTAEGKITATSEALKAVYTKSETTNLLGGYATKTWAQTQIKTSADEINGTMSSIKSTVDRQTTSINDLKSDSSSFKSQFTKVTDTIGKQTTDISTLQASSKELTTGFNTLTTDNGTNQHNIGELQQSAKDFSSTLTTVQTQVQNSAVGTNLLTNTSDFSSNWRGMTSISTITEYNGHPSMVFASSSERQLAIHSLSLGKLQNSTKYTSSFWAKADNAGDKAHTELWGSIGATDFVLTTNWVRYSAVLTSAFDAETITGHSHYFLGIDDGNKGNVYIALPKLEKGNLATDWCPNPADNATVTAVSSISQTIEKIQGTIINKADKSQITQLAYQITSVVGDPDNMIISGDFEDQRDYLGKQSPYWSGSNIVANNGDKVNGNNPSSTILQINGQVSGNNDVTGINFIAVDQAEYKFSLKLRWLSNNQLGTIIIYAFEYDANKNLIAPQSIAQDKTPNGWHTLTGTYKPSSDKVRYIRFDVTYNGAQGTTPIQADDIRMSLNVANQSQITQLKDDISLRVEKAGVINAVNVSSEGIQIYGNKLHITADTYIDNAVIKDAMISNVSANKMTTGTLNAANVNVINLNGSHIVSNSITSNQLASGSVTADKIQSGAIRVSLNHSLQRLEIGVDGMNLMSNDGAIIGRIHSNHMNYDSTFWGLSFDMSANGGDYMAWGAQNNGDVNGIYQTKLAWYRWATHGYNGGFHFQDRVEFHNTVQFRNSIDTRANYLLGFGSTNVSGYSSVPYLGLSGGATKISFSPGSVWLSRHNNYYNMGAVIEGFSHFLGKAIFIPTGMRSDGRASSWLGINIPSS